MHRTLWRLTVSVAAIFGALAGNSAFAQKLTIEVLSSRPELVSGGDALVRIVGAPSAPSVALGTSDVSSAFKAAPNGGFVGLVKGLKDGANQLTAKAGGAGEASVTLVNHPINGTLFAGPQ